jgi:uncharacterized membrane protein YcaP (DUF421 family)
MISANNTNIDPNINVCGSAFFKWSPLYIEIIFVLFADIIGRLIVYPYEINIGLTIGVFGTVIFYQRIIQILTLTSTYVEVHFSNGRLYTLK